jgi:hypothetical protein
MIKIMKTPPARPALDIRAGRGQRYYVKRMLFVFLQDWGRGPVMRYIMKKMMPVLLLCVLCGCGTPYTFSPYIGEQQNWQTEPGSYVKVVDKATLYLTGHFPNRPYIIIGSVATDNEENVAKAIHDQQADAALIYTDRTYRTGSVAVAGPGMIWNVPLTGRQVNAQLIKFK